MDARRMEYVPDQCFDLIIDKALFDALLCSENNLADVECLLREMSRILKSGGVYLIISHAPPERRMLHLEKYLLGMSVEVVAMSKYYVHSQFDFHTYFRI
jgi:ubiquinone/menaquinone biosynthesis C-methylase UbiE